METSFNEQLRERTLAFAVAVNGLFVSKSIKFVNRSMVTQILKSSSSVAANFRAASRARSDAEFYSKICIVTEECDETHSQIAKWHNGNMVKSFCHFAFYQFVL
jgi:four helix bundle protein